MNRDKYKDLFTTYNLNLATVLMSQDIKLETVDKSFGNRSIFCFENTPKLQDIQIKYWKKELRVEPQVLFDSLKFLKNLLYSNLGGSNGI